MNVAFKIKLTALILIFSLAGYAQSEKFLIPFSNNLLINPSFAGLDENTNVWSGLQVNSFSEKEVYNQFSLTYDYFSEKLGGGMAFYFQQGLIGSVNINTVETGFTISKQLEIKKGMLIPSLNLNLELANKQWYVQFIDQMLDKETTEPAPPGYDFSRYARVKPKVGFMWSTDFFKTGFTALVPFGTKISDEDNQVNMNDPVFLFHFSRLSGGRRRGLESKPFQAKPQLILLYSQDDFISRAELNFEEVYNTYSFFIQNNFSRNLHAVGGTFGWKLDNFRINIAAGARLPYISEDVSFFGEVSLRLLVPSVFYSEQNPWQPEKKLF